jgi:hypothetical protein
MRINYIHNDTKSRPKAASQFKPDDRRSGGHQLREMLTEAVRNTQPEPKRPPPKTRDPG